MSDINISNTDIVLDLYNNNFVEVTSKQYDKSTRTISALVSEYGKVIQIPNGVTAQVRMKKPDGKGIIKDCTISNNKIVIVEDEQMLLFAGRHKVDVVLFTDTQRVSTLSFILIVESAAVSDEDVLSSNEYSALDKALKDCRDTVADINRRLEAGEFNGGPPGTRGSQWTQGTSITGTDTSPNVFNASGISDALVNDCYFNTATGNTYRCVSAGDASQAKWVYTGCLKSISNSSAITEEGQYSIDAVQANPSIEGTLANKQERINESLGKSGTTKYIIGLKETSQSIDLSPFKKIFLRLKINEYLYKYIEIPKSDIENVTNFRAVIDHKYDTQSFVEVEVEVSVKSCKIAQIRIGGGYTKFNIDLIGEY